MNTGNLFGKMLNSSALLDIATNTEPNLNLSQDPEIDQQLNILALFLAQTWQDHRVTADIEPSVNFQACLLYVTTEMAQAAMAVGGPIELEILIGGGFAVAYTACKQVLSMVDAESQEAAPKIPMLFSCSS